MTLRDKLESGRFVMTAEVTPPVSMARSDLLDRALPLKGLADAVNVTDGAGARPHLGALTAAAMLLAEGIEPILQLTCRDRNRIALQSDLMSAAALGIENLLMLRGDNPEAGDQPETKGVFDIDTRALMTTARDLRDKGMLPPARAVAGHANFFIGGADNPIDPPPGWQPESLRGKLASGAQFLQTQFCMDAGVVARYCARLAEAGIAKQVYLLIGVAPLKSAKSARWMRDKLFGSIIPDDIVARMEQAADPAAEGEEICVALIEQLARTPGVAGVHVMAPNNVAALPRVLSAARERVAKVRG
ncbi:MAG: methylenetetrahydrofolate reductase [Pseudolabrys sp.]